MKWDVTEVYGYNSKVKLFIFKLQRKVYDKEIYSLNLNKSIKSNIYFKGTNDADFSSNFQYFINTTQTKCPLTLL